MKTEPDTHTTHDYLGMRMTTRYSTTFDYGIDGKVAIRMESYIESVLEELPDVFESVKRFRKFCISLTESDSIVQHVRSNSKNRSRFVILILALR